ncbi:MAG: peptide chain release factor 1 [Bacillota bacterium]|jgi:peptide chain release factor 1
MEENLRNRLKVMRNRLTTIDDLLVQESVLSDSRQFKSLSKERATLDKVVTLFNTFETNEKNLADALVMRNDADPEIAQLGKVEVEQLTEAQDKLMEQIKFHLIPKDPNDDKNIVVEIRGAAGGDEAFIFASDLFRMYTKYCEKNGWKIQMLSDAGGQSTITFMVKGDAVYSKLKFESGAHRVQRVPATEASGRIHTSTATVLVMPEVEEVDIVINTNDLQVDTYRSQGAGGQNVNKTESAVRITHLPTGIVVSCQIEKSQIQNRELAMKMLYAKLEAHKQAEIDEKVGNERKLKVGTGERSEKIRTYNYPQNRVTDHRIGFTINQLDRVMEGQIEDIIEALNHFDQQQKLLGVE